MNGGQKSIVLATLTIAITSISLFITENYAFAIEYANFTNDKYHFQHPADWEISEKSSRFDSGPDVQITKPASSTTIKVIPIVTSEVIGQADDSLKMNMFLNAQKNDFSRETRVIEEPSFLTINGNNAGTFVFTEKDKYEEFAPITAVQPWLIFDGNSMAGFSFHANPDEFDSPENIAIRDNLVKSFKLLGVSEDTTNINKTTSRFD